MIDVKYNEVKDRNSWIDGNYLNATICVTEDCNLRCTYCYMVGKNNVNRMNWETGKQIIDFLLDNPYTSEMSDSIMLDFIGGEPLLEMDLIDKMCDYFILRMYSENHKWFPNYVFTFSTNGVLYGKENVRNYVNKHGEHCAFSISIDGIKEKHDMTRKKIDGSGSYEDVIKNLPMYLEENYNPSTKSTFASADLPFLKDSIIHLWDMEEMGEDYVSGNPLEEGYADNADDGKTADTVSDQENILDEMGITSQQEDMKNPEASTENYGLGEGGELVKGEEIEPTQEQGNLSDLKENSVSEVPAMEAENTGSSYAEGMLDTDSIPVESENGQEVLTEADGALDYPREEETATSVGMDLDGGTIGESEMDLEGVTSGSAGREYSAQEVSGGMETSGSGILNEIGESGVSTSKGESVIPKFSEETREHPTGDYLSSQNEFGQGAERRISDVPTTGEMETSDVLGREMLIQGQNLRESVLPNEAERSLKLEDGIPEVPKSRRELRQGYDERKDW